MKAETIMSSVEEAYLPVSVLSGGDDAALQDEAYEALRGKDDHLVLVLDDDPTGIQTVHDVNVYMQWSEEIMDDIFTREPLAFIQTNSRSLLEEDAVRLTRDIVGLALAASKKTGRDFRIVSRSDSSLRGHFPAETDTIAEVLQEEGRKVDGIILCFFLPEAGRFTINDTHYIREGEVLVPAAQTEFAKDAVFGYHHSRLSHYIEEKTAGRVKAANVQSIPLEWLREQQTELVTARLKEITGGDYLVVNAGSYQDLRQFVRSLKAAEKSGKQFLFRTAASFVKTYGFITEEPLLTAEQILENQQEHSGSVVTIVGSHTRKTTAQLAKLLLEQRVVPIEVAVEGLLQKDRREAEIANAVYACEEAMKSGGHPVVYTSRILVLSEDEQKQKNLHISQTVSEGLVQVVSRLKTKPLAVIAKGGITSSDIAVKGLGMNKALILGQVRPSIPVVRAGEESRFPGMPYIIFPGNTGTEEDLAGIWRELVGGREKF